MSDNGLALGDVAKQSGLSSFGKVKLFRNIVVPATNYLAMIA
jgi:hypothetical protein